LVKAMFNSIGLQEVRLALEPKLMEDIDFERMKKGLKFLTVKQFFDSPAKDAPQKPQI
jgi:hypothetical protein